MGSGQHTAVLHLSSGVKTTSQRGSQVPVVPSEPIPTEGHSRLLRECYLKGDGFPSSHFQNKHWFNGH